MEDRELQNRKRCLQCEHYGMNVCPLMANGDVFNLDICILDVVKKKNWNDNSPEMFMFKNNPTLFLKYLSFLRKDKLPNIGDKVITLRSGFGGWGGNIRFISDVNDEYIELQDSNDSKFISYINVWHNDLFVFDENN